MSAPIGPGDWVECVSAEIVQFAWGSCSLGGLYCVTECQRNRAGECGARLSGGGPCGTALRFHGVRHSYPGTTPDVFCACAFRPIYRPKADLIASLSAPPKVQKTPETVGASSREED
jgi:hypothetical protein